MGQLSNDNIFENHEITYSSAYQKWWGGPALFAAVFGWLPDLYVTLSQFTPLEDQPSLRLIFNSVPIYIESINGNLRVGNYPASPGLSREDTKPTRHLTYH